MPETAEKFYLTTPIYYVNARPHIGHAYTTIAADVIARRHRLLGDDTFFLTGTDEHGQKTERSAAAAIPPQHFADQISIQFRDLWDRMGLTYDIYNRTTDVKHIPGAQKLFAAHYERGAIYLSSYTSQYCVSEEIFVEGPPGTIGPDGRPTETVTEENFFFRLSDYQLPLLDLIESNTLHIAPDTRKNEVLSFLRGNVVEARAQGLEIARSAMGIEYVKGELRDLSVSRSSFTWGIPIPEPAASTTDKKHVMYVWLDALANYLTGIGYGSDDPAEQAKFKKYWPADLHLVGKEITRQHCIYWPAFLLAAGLPLPKSIIAHGWLLFEESKMSKSRGNVVRTETILDAFGDEVYGKQFPESTKAERDLFAADVLRYFLLREIPFGQDGSFSFDALITRYNADLANGYGNLVSRTLNMINTSFEGKIPDVEVRHSEGQDELGVALRIKMLQVTKNIEDEKDSYNFTNYLAQISGLIAATDAYLSAEAPWKLAKLNDDRNQQRLKRVLFIAAESIKLITICLDPFMPFTTGKVWTQLGFGSTNLSLEKGQLTACPPGTKLGPLAPIFPRADKGLAQIMTDMENPTTPETTTAAPAETAAPTAPATAATPAAPTDNLQPATDNSPQITIDDFAKVDLRIAQIVVAERIPKADKLLRLEVDLGPNFPRRQILAGIAEYYTPESLIGRKVVIVANLAPRKMRGLESQGMVVAASIGPAGAPVLAGFLEEVELGARLK